MTRSRLAIAVAVLGAVAAVALHLPVAAHAQDVSVDFRLAAAPGNIQGCLAADPQFTRLHTFSVRNGQAELTAPGGIQTRMKLAKPGIYDTEYQLGRLHLFVVADLNARTLTVTEKSLGCKWTATQE